MVTESQIANRKSQMLSWQGWQLSIADDWNPVKIEGDYDEGSMLIADMTTARLGVRWRKAPRKTQPEQWARKVFEAEIGSSAANEVNAFDIPDSEAWRISQIYEEPDPPARDVWAGWSDASGRVIEIVYHVHHREPTLTRDVLPTLTDTGADEATPWAVFDLRLQTPPGLKLQWYKLNAGDLSLAFSTARGRRNTIIRQVGPATLALARQPLHRWLIAQHYAMRKMYRLPDDPQPTELTINGATLPGLRALLPRRRRLWWAGGLVARQLVLIGVVDERRNRVVIGQSDDESLLRQIMSTVGSEENIEWDVPNVESITR